MAEAWERSLVVFPDPETLCEQVAGRFLAVLREHLASQESVTVALTGGSMGIGVLAATQRHPERDSVDWGRVQVWWGDERWVAEGHADRNDAQARDALLNALPLRPEHVHPFPASDAGLSLDEAAAAATAELAQHAAEGQSWPIFDLVFLGVGPDGHIASLFPGRTEVAERQAPVLAIRNSPKPPAERLTLTRPVINSAKRVWLVLAGAEKASVLGLALAGAQYGEVPAAGAKGRQETIFFADTAAASEVPESLGRPGDEFHALHRPVLDEE